MLDISRPIIVEGRYDKIKLRQVVNANIITTDGFGVFKNSEKTKLIRKLAAKNGVIVLTDSDGAGLVIRNFLKNILKKEQIINIYTPQIAGKEKRKKEPSKEGFLGVEGMDLSYLEKALAPYADGEAPKLMSLTKADLYAYRLSGHEDSKILRDRLAKKLDLPCNLSANALLEACNLLITEEDFKKAVATLQE